jgi:hypothetical protein
VEIYDWYDGQGSGLIYFNPDNEASGEIYPEISMQNKINIFQLDFIFCLIFWLNYTRKILINCLKIKLNN